jgi:hypothetical protein
MVESKIIAPDTYDVRQETVGKVARDLQLKDDGYAVNVIDQQREMTQDYMKNLFEAVDRGYKQFAGDFFVHVETKKEKLLENVLRNYFIIRETCPTPNYDQTVFRYHREKGDIQFFWTIPDRNTCFYFKQNALEVIDEEKELLKFVLQFDDGTLLKLCKKLNGEKTDTIIKGLY